VANLIAVIVIVSIINCRVEPEQDKGASCFPCATAVPEIEAVPTRAETGTQPQGKCARKLEVEIEVQEAVTPAAGGAAVFSHQRPHESEV